MSELIHIAIVRRVRPGCEAEFQKALLEFMQASFVQAGVYGANMIIPPPGTPSPEFGILRTFANEQEHAAFYKSAIYKEWEDRIRHLIAGESVHRRLNGLEAWFRSSSNPPPRWKMALLTWVAVWPVSMAVPAALNLLLGQSLPNFLFAGAVAAGIVVVLTWIAMPVLVSLAKKWLQPETL